MAVGLDQDTESLQRGSIPSGGAGTLSDGAFTNCFAGVWLYRQSSTATYALTAGGAIIHFQAGAREVVLGFNSAGSALADLNLQITFNSGGGTGAVQTFSGHAGNSLLDEWVYYFIAENSTDGQIAGYIRLADLATATTITRTNDNAGSQYVNTLTFGNVSGNSAVVLGHYAYARAAYNTSTGYNTTDALSFAASTSPTGMWGFWPLADNTDNVDDSGNSRDLTFNGTLTSESDPGFGVEVALTGVSATGQVGTVDRAFSPSTSFQSLGFQSNAFAILGGDVSGSPDVTLSLTGVSATGQIGTLASSISYALSGVAGTGSVGSVVNVASYALTSASAAGQVGTVVPSITYALTGTQGSGAVGTVVPAVSYALSGVNATGNVGSVVANVTYELTGASATGQVGTVSTGSDVTLALNGVEATSAIGSVVSALSYSLTGVSSSGQVGSVTAAPSYALSGNQATSSVGSVGDEISYALSGVSAAGEVGSVAVPGDVTRALSGVEATGEVGSVSAESAVPSFPSRAGAGVRRNYIIKGKRYRNLTNEELAYLLARDLIDATRADVKVTYKNKKPHMVSKAAWDSLQSTLKDLEQLIEPPFDEDDEESAAMLLL